MEQCVHMKFPQELALTYGINYLRIKKSYLRFKKFLLIHLLWVDSTNMHNNRFTTPSRLYMNCE